MFTMFQLQEIIDECKFPNLEIRLRCDEYNETWSSGIEHKYPYLQVFCKGKCNITGEPAEWSSRKWNLSFHMVKSEVVRTAFKAVVGAMMHETEELFTYKGESIYNPHYDVDRLVELRRSKKNLSYRKESMEGA